MSKKPCACCKTNKGEPVQQFNGIGYNRLNGDARDWAKDNGFPRSEFCTPVKGGKKFGGPKWLKDKCGDGSMGFSTRRKGQEEVRIVVGGDGQLRKKRHTLVRRKSANAVSSRRPRRVDGSKCKLASSVEVKLSCRDPEEVLKISRSWKQMKLREKFRGVNRNKARRAAKQNHKRQLKQAA